MVARSASVMPWNSGLSSAAPGGWRAERIDLDAQMAVLADGLNQGRGPCDFA